MINFQDVRLYFHYDDSVTTTLFDLVSNEMDNRRLLPEYENFHKEYESDIDNLVKTNEEPFTVLTDTEYSKEIYRLMFKYSYLMDIDVLPIIFRTLKTDSIRYISETKFQEFIVNKRDHNGHADYSADEVKKFWDTAFGTLTEETSLKLAKTISLNTDKVEIVREVFTWVVDINGIPKNGLDKMMLKDSFAAASTLSNFGGTISQAHELIKRYIGT